eukprot:7975158-Prorocentrum_lima.AAC.1
MTSSLVGSEMCIRDRDTKLWDLAGKTLVKPSNQAWDQPAYDAILASATPCLLYTSDAADDM